MSDVRVTRQGVGEIDYIDQSDGSWAEAVYGAAYGALAGSDIVVPQWPSGARIRYRDMSDGSFAEVVYMG